VNKSFTGTGTAVSSIQSSTCCGASSSSRGNEYLNCAEGANVGFVVQGEEVLGSLG